MAQLQSGSTVQLYLEDGDIFHDYMFTFGYWISGGVVLLNDNHDEVFYPTHRIISMQAIKDEEPVIWNE